MSNRLIVGAAAAALVLQASIGAFAATSVHGVTDRRADHYTTVLSNDVRDCTMLDSEFRQAARGSHGASVSADAEALHQEGAKLCHGGAGEAGAVKEAQAVRAEGAIPRLF